MFKFWGLAEGVENVAFCAGRTTSGVDVWLVCGGAVALDLRIIILEKRSNLGVPLGLTLCKSSRQLFLFLLHSSRILP